uniref:CDT1 domain-containing protein n=1 Tax=Bursaphelenchus xylophilus TaxID=6326 RepID=A0A1I7RYQ8_BURXY
MKLFKWRRKSKAKSEPPADPLQPNFYSTTIIAPQPSSKSSLNPLTSITALNSASNLLGTPRPPRPLHFTKRPQSLAIQPDQKIDDDECSSGTYTPSVSTVFAQTVRTATSVASAQCAFKTRNGQPKGKAKRKTSRVSFQLGPPTTITEGSKKAMSECGTVSSKRPKPAFEAIKEKKDSVSSNLSAKLYMDYVVKLSGDWTQVEVIHLANDQSAGLGFGIVGGASTGVVVKTILPGTCWTMPTRAALTPSLLEEHIRNRIAANASASEAVIEEVVGRRPSQTSNIQEVNSEAATISPEAETQAEIAESTRTEAKIEEKESLNVMNDVKTHGDCTSAPSTSNDQSHSVGPDTMPEKLESADSLQRVSRRISNDVVAHVVNEQITVKKESNLSFDSKHSMLQQSGSNSQRPSKTPSTDRPMSLKNLQEMVNESALYGESHVTVRQELGKAATAANKCDKSIRLFLCRKIQQVNLYMPSPGESLPLAYPLLAAVHDDRLVKAKSEWNLSLSKKEYVDPSPLRSRSLEQLSSLAIWNCVPIVVTLEKDSRGLGFSIIDYQDPLHPDETVIVIRSLVPGGVAQADGRIVPGDRLLFVNGVDLSSSSLQNAVDVLKSAPLGLVRIGIAKPVPVNEFQLGAHSPIISRSERLLAKGSSPRSRRRRLHLGTSEQLLGSILGSHTSVSAVSSSEEVWIGADLYRRLNPQLYFPSSGSATPTTPRSHCSMFSWTPCSSRSVSPVSSPISLKGSWSYDVISLPPHLERSIKVMKGALPMGIVLDADVDKAINGCVVKSICSKKAIGRDGRVQVGDYIVRLNTENLRNVTNSQARAILKRTNLVGTQCNITYITASDAKLWKERFHREQSLNDQGISRLSPKVHPKFYRSPFLGRKGLASQLSQDSNDSRDLQNMNIDQLSDEFRKRVDDLMEEFIRAVFEDTVTELRAIYRTPDWSDATRKKSKDREISLKPPPIAPKPTIIPEPSKSQPSTSQTAKTQEENIPRAHREDSEDLPPPPPLPSTSESRPFEGKCSEESRPNPPQETPEEGRTVPSSTVTFQVPQTTAKDRSPSPPLPPPPANLPNSPTRSNGEIVNLKKTTQEVAAEVEVSHPRLSLTTDASTNTLASSASGQSGKEEQPRRRSNFWSEERSVVLLREPNETFGISIVGGRVEVSQKGGLPGTGSTVAGIFIKSVLPDSPAGRSNRMFMGDRVISVNDVDLRSATHEQAVLAIKNARNPVSFVVQSLQSFSADKVSPRRGPRTGSSSDAEN